MVTSNKQFNMLPRMRMQEHFYEIAGKPYNHFKTRREKGCGYNFNEISPYFDIGIEIILGDDDEDDKENIHSQILK